MQIHDITSAAGRHKRRKRVGRGEASGSGKTSGRGQKGAQSRAGYGTGLLYIGGSQPLFRRVPKRGFSNFHFRTEYEVVNLDTLDKSFQAGDRVDIDGVRKLHLIPGKLPYLKILARGAISKKLNIEAHAISEKAKAAIEGAGGSVKILPMRDPAAIAKQKRNSAKKSAKSSKKA